MCGIAGWVEPRGAAIDAAHVRAMTAALAHRGPDGEGIHIEPGCALGHRRLSLIDLQGGQQPVSNESGSVWVVGNSEIYNYRELRQQLADRGHCLRSAGDTEVLTHLYEDLGEGCVDVLVGMFAFALWDRASQTLLLVRDRFGIKPLYYTVDARGGLRFASELRALLPAPGVDRSIDPTALHGYLRDLTIPEPRTIYRNVHKLPAAHCLTWRDGQIRLRRYWTLGERHEPQISDSDAEADLEAKLVESTALALRSDVPVGLFLSGGLDSSLYNAGNFVTDTIDSVLAQEGIDFELLIADDASIDDTRDRLRRYSGHPRVRLSFNERNRGAAATRNALIRDARGTYVTPFDADDLMLPGCLAVQAEFLDAHAAVGVIYGDILIVWLDDQGRVTEPPVISGSDCNRGWDLRDNLINHGGSMSRRALLEQVGGYDESVGSVDDWSLWLKMAEITRIHYLAGELTCVWRRHRDSLTCVDPHRARDIEKIIREAAARRMGRGS